MEERSLRIIPSEGTAVRNSPWEIFFSDALRTIYLTDASISDKSINSPNLELLLYEEERNLGNWSYDVTALVGWTMTSYLLYYDNLHKEPATYGPWWSSGLTR